MLLEKLFDNLALKAAPFASCRLADGWRLRLPCRDWVTLHYILQGDGALPWLSALDDPRLARVAHMSRSTFARHFEQCFGRTPMDYMRDVRLRRAAQLLRVSGLSVDGVASKVGFASRSNFSRAFHDQFGCSPMDFRKQER
jgi:AraC-like DNA-binding protein